MTALKEGDIVRYVGEKHLIYADKVMQIAQINKDGMVNCSTEDEGFTTWLYSFDFVLVG